MCVDYRSLNVNLIKLLQYKGDPDTKIVHVFRWMFHGTTTNLNLAPWLLWKAGVLSNFTTWSLTMLITLTSSSKFIIFFRIHVGGSNFYTTYLCKYYFNIYFCLLWFFKWIFMFYYSLSLKTKDFYGFSNWICPSSVNYVYLTLTIF